MSDAGVILDLVRRQDRDRYLSALLAPREVRDALLAVYALNIELASVAEKVREPHLGEIRLQWWRDVLAAGGDSGHAIADAVAKVRAAHALPDILLDAMIDARSFDVAREPMPSLAALRDYLHATAGGVFEAAARICGAPAEAAAAIARHAAVAHGLTGLMRALPFHASQGRMFLPADVLHQHGADPYALLRGEDGPQLNAALAHLREIAIAELAAVREAFPALPATAHNVFLPLALTGPLLGKLAVPAHRPLHIVVDIAPLVRVWRIWRAHRRGQL